MGVYRAEVALLKFEVVLAALNRAAFLSLRTQIFSTVTLRILVLTGLAGTATMRSSKAKTKRTFDRSCSALTYDGSLFWWTSPHHMEPALRGLSRFNSCYRPSIITARDCASSGVLLTCFF